MRPTARGLILALGVVPAFALVVAWSRPWSLAMWSTARYSALLAALAVSLAITVLAWHRGRARRATPGSLACGALCFSVAAALPWFSYFQPFKALWLMMYAGLAVGVFATAWWLGPAIARRTPERLRHGIALLACQIAVTAVVAELGLRALALVHPSPVLAADASPGAIFARYRRAPGELHLGLPCDERGFNDRLRREPGTRLIASIGDSFSFGLVPRTFHYTTIAERRLSATEIYNTGVIAAGPAEYLRILDEDVLPLAPDAVLIALFVGNDVEEAARFDAPAAILAQLFDRAHLRLWNVPRRLLRLRDEPGEDRPPGSIQGGDAGAIDPDPAVLLERFPWLDDPALERPTMSERNFRYVEQRRASFVCDPAQQPAYRQLFRALDAILERAADIPIAVLLIPDEFQVEDSLWATLDTSSLERDLPQRRIAAWLEARGVDHLDLLPVLRAVTPLDDGGRHLYHLRDTHWNRRGNEAAGDAVADFVRRWLGD